MTKVKINATNTYKEIPGFPGYEVCNGATPKVRRIADGKILHETKMTGDGGNTYAYVTVFNNGKFKGVPLHRLAALAWLPNPRGCRIVDHIDDDTSNNACFGPDDHRNNLRWATDHENHSKPSARLKARTGQKIRRIREKVNKFVTIAVSEIRLDLEAFRAEYLEHTGELESSIKAQEGC